MYRCNLSTNLNEVFNTENNLFIDSTYRNIASFPNPNTFQMNLNQGFSHVQELVLTHFIVNGGTVPGPYVYIIIDEFSTTMCYTPGSPIANYNFIIPGGISTYISQEPNNDKIVFPKQGATNIQRLTIRIVDSTGAPALINDFVMKFYVRSLY